MPLLLPLTLLSVGLLAVVALSGVLLLQACALAWAPLGWLGACTPGSERAAEVELAALDDRRLELERTIYGLERELAAIQCTATGPDRTRPLVPRGWENESREMLFGCWDVSLGYRTRDVDTDAVAQYSQWQMCFDAKGEGRQIMRDTAGVTCEGPVTAQYSGGGLALIEADNLPCSDGGYIHRREISCRIDTEGGAVCSTLQPETGGAADVSLVRAVR